MQKTDVSDCRSVVVKESSGIIDKGGNKDKQGCERKKHCKHGD